MFEIFQPTQKPTEQMRRADIHLHTTYSDGIASPAQRVRKALRRDLDGIAITDHNTIRGGVEAKNYAIQKGLPEDFVLVGTEVAALLDDQPIDILGIGLEDDIVPNQSPFATFEAIHKQGGVAILAHPGLLSASAVSLDQLRMLLHRDFFAD